MIYLSSSMWLILKPVQSHTCTGVPKGGQQHFTTVQHDSDDQCAGWLEECWQQSHPPVCFVKMRVGLDESIVCNHWEWRDKPGRSCAPRAEGGHLPGKEVHKVLQRSCRRFIPVLQQSYWSWYPVDAERQLVAVVQGPKLPWYLAFFKTSNTVISVETGTSPYRKRALLNMLFFSFLCRKWLHDNKII